MFDAPMVDPRDVIANASSSSDFWSLLRQLGDEHEREVSLLRKAILETVITSEDELVSVKERAEHVASEVAAVTESPRRQVLDFSQEHEFPERHDSRTVRRLDSSVGKQLDTIGAEVFNRVRSKCRSTREPGTRFSRLYLSDYAMYKGWVDKVERTHSRPLTQKLVDNPIFDGVCAAAIMLNCFLLGIITDFGARYPDQDTPIVYQVFDRIFSAWFLVEILLRLCADGCFHFLFVSKHWRWNDFDLAVVLTDIAETTVVLFAGDLKSSFQNLTVIRMLRILRIARAARVFRLIRFFKEIRMMVLSLLRSGMSLFWSMFLLAIINFIFAIYFTQNATVHVQEAAGEITDDMKDDLLKYYGTLVLAMYSLFQAVSGGISWAEIANPLVEIHWTNGLVFCFFVFFTVFAMLNIITGIFVETAIHSAQTDRDEMIQEQIQYEESTLRKLQRIFEDADKDDSGTLSEQEFETLLKDRAVRAHLASLGVEVSEAAGIFKLLDIDSSKTVEIEEFCFGCMRMKGGARAVDLAALMYENKRIISQLLSFFTFVEMEFETQRSHNELCAKTLRALQSSQPHHTETRLPSAASQASQARPELKPAVSL